MTLNLDQILQIHLAGDLALAEKAYRYLLNQPNPDTLVLINLAAICSGSDRKDEAISLLERAIQIKSDSAEAYYNYANILQDLGRYPEANSFYKQALKYQPHFPQAHYNWGNCSLKQEQFTEAILHYELALVQDSEHYNAHINLAMTSLLLGNFSKGWNEYEYRFLASPSIITVPEGLEKWDEDLSYEGTLLLVYEQGFGDTIQFLRYAFFLSTLGIKVALLVQEPLKELITHAVSEIWMNLSCNEPVENIPVYSSAKDSCSKCSSMKWFSMMSLPRFFQTDESNIPSLEQYIFVPESLKELWRHRMGTSKKLRIAIAWQGNPSHELRNSEGRSFSLEALAEIAKIQNVEFVSVQKFAGSEQLETCSFKDKFIHCQDEISASTDFLDTAAIMQQCDLVISSDTSVAHLAGSLGLRTWLALKKVPEWRWMLEGTTTPWYPSMRLFRQKQDGNWDDVFKEMASELKNTLNLAA